MADDEIRRVVRTAADAAPGAPGLAGSVIRGARRRQQQRQSLVAVSVVVALSGTAVAVVERPNRPDRLTFAQGDDVRYTCGGIGPSFAADAIRNPLGAENADDPATAVLRGHTTPENSPYIQSKGWRELARTDDEVIWTTGPEFGYYGVKKSGDMWKYAYAGGGCRFTRVLPDRVRAAAWKVTGRASPDARSVDLLVARTKNSPREIEHIVELRQHAVVITVALRYPRAKDDGQVALLVPEEPEYTRYTVELGEPIGDRQLLDGALFPAVPVPTADQNASSCGLYPLHLDNLEIRAGAATRFWPADYCPAGEQRFSLLTEGRHAEMPLAAVPAGTSRRNGRTPHVVNIPPVSSGPAAIIARGSACGFCVVGYTPAFVLEGLQPESSPSPEPTPSSGARVSIAMSPASPQVGEKVAIVGTLHAPHGAPLSVFRTDWGDGNGGPVTSMNECGAPVYTHSETAEYTYDKPGTYTITVYMKASGCARTTDEATGTATVTVRSE